MRCGGIIAPGAGDGWDPGAGAYLFDGAAFDVEGGGWYGDGPRETGGGAFGGGNVELVAWDGCAGAYACAAVDGGREIVCGGAVGGDMIRGGASPAFGGGGKGGVGLW